ncbi:MAG: hypothetical protein K2Z81_16660, partial [Cyanobacteria bacterium]|nr:hypothetical protein [Cyanobacteriota bacterium]
MNLLTPIVLKKVRHNHNDFEINNALGFDDIVLVGYEAYLDDSGTERTNFLAICDGRLDYVEEFDLMGCAQLYTASLILSPAAIGAKGGAIGGKSRSEAKVAAARQTARTREQKG